ncbi:hypothetical protein Pst134EB_030968 [Puccinia striiformis f. sp. tritici]|nr:hypothetical protein Pst134EB_030968 [Puccinia striiformis f. sp. tritici]
MDGLKGFMKDMNERETCIQFKVVLKNQDSSMNASAMYTANLPGCQFRKLTPLDWCSKPQFFLAVLSSLKQIIMLKHLCRPHSLSVLLLFFCPLMKAPPVISFP